MNSSISPHHHPQLAFHLFLCISVNDTSSPSWEARYLGIIIDAPLSLTSHLKFLENLAASTFKIYPKSKYCHTLV